VLRDPEAAAEVLQEVFWQVWREAPRYDPERGSPEAWLVTRAPRPGWASRSAPGRRARASASSGCVER
jgi:RNA polymerase sigma-70 factor (ECF subfamily)